MSNPQIAYAPRAGATPETEISALANVYRFVLDCRAKKKAVPDRRPDDAERRSSDGATGKYKG